MSEHKVLALKYRPRSFKELIGQDAVSQTLSLALDSGKLSHAYLFSGLRGSGKTSSARIFAKSLLCDKGVSAAPCEECDNCRAANEGRHIDIIEMDAASNTSVDDIRDLIEQTKYAPSIGRRKIFIIDEVHMLSKSAFNAFLKTLEEPPEKIVFLLATTDAQKLPPTVLSRVQHFRFKKIAYEAVLTHIKQILAQEAIAADEKALEIIARSGGGSMRDTLTILEQAIAFGKGSLNLSATIELLGALDPERIEQFFAYIFARDSEGAIAFIKEIEGDDPEMIIGEMTSYLKDRLFKPRTALSAGALPFSASLIERFFRILAETRTLLRYNADSGFALALMAMKMIDALRPESVMEAIERIENELENSGALAGVGASAASASSAAASTPIVAVAVKPQPSQPLQSSQSQSKAPKIADQNALFNDLKRRLTDRSRALGDAANAAVRFVGFENGEFRAIFAKSDLLRQEYAVFLNVVHEVFGENTKIVKVKESDLDPSPVVPVDPAPANPAPTKDEKEEILKEEVLAEQGLKTAIEVLRDDIEKITPIPKKKKS